MKKILSVLFLFSILVIGTKVEADDTFSIFIQKKRYGLKNSQETVTVKPIYSRMIKLGSNSWIVMRRGKYGLINSDGEIIVPLKYISAERVYGKYLKVYDNYKTTLFDEDGNIIIPPKYTKIDVLENDLLRVYKNYKYGIIDINGNTIIEREFDDLFMSQRNTFQAKYKGDWHEIKIQQIKPEQNPFDTNQLPVDDDKLKAEDIAVNIGAVPLYSVVTVTDYGLKPITTLVPAWSDTIDNLFLNKGVDAIPTLMSGIWIPMMPYYYCKSYIQNLFRPDQGPLSYPRQSVKKMIR